MAILLLPSCTTTAPLAEYGRYNGTARQNLPGDYIAYLKQARFTHGELEHLPRFGILFHGDPTKYFGAIGVKEGEVTVLDLGTTDTSTLYVVRPAGGVAYVINRAQPGAGGTATQAGELAALGVTYVVHVGTSGLLGSRLNEKTVTVGEGSYKDGGAQLLSTEPRERMSRPDRKLTDAIERALKRAGVPAARAVGYTIPIYYFQPEGLIRGLIGSREFGSPRPEYVEMEEAPFFESARLTHTAAASLTVGADRYVVTADGKLAHTFLDDAAVDRSLAGALRACVAAFGELGRYQPNL